MTFFFFFAKPAHLCHVESKNTDASEALMYGVSQTAKVERRRKEAGARDGDESGNRGQLSIHLDFFSLCTHNAARYQIKGTVAH